MKVIGRYVDHLFAACSRNNKCSVAKTSRGCRLMTIRMMMKAKNAIYEFTQIGPWLFLFAFRFINSRRVFGALFILSGRPPSSRASSIFVCNNIIIGNSRRVAVEAVDIFIGAAHRRDSNQKNKTICLN